MEETLDFQFSFFPSILELCLLICARSSPVPPAAIFTHKMLYKHSIIIHTDLLCYRIPLEDRQYELQGAGNELIMCFEETWGVEGGAF